MVAGSTHMDICCVPVQKKTTNGTRHGIVCDMVRDMVRDMVCDMVCDMVRDTYSPSSTNLMHRFLDRGVDELMESM